MTPTRTYWTQPTPFGEIGVVADRGCVQEVSLPGAAFAPPADAVEGVDVSIAEQLDEYFGGTRKEFDCDVDLSSVRGEYAREVLEALALDVAYGETVTYGELAQITGRPRAARAVGNALAHNPVPIIVPCHRVLAANGLGGFGGSDKTGLKRRLLALEGVQV